MPVRIKHPEMKPREKSFCVSTLICTVISFLFTVEILTMLRNIVTNGSKVMTCAVVAGYLLFTVICGICLYKGFAAYKYEDSMSALGKGIIYFFEVIVCLINLRFALSLIFSVFGKEEITKKITGTDQNAFIQAQTIPWTALLGGLFLADVIGIFSARKLLKYQKKR